MALRPPWYLMSAPSPRSSAPGRTSSPASEWTGDAIREAFLAFYQERDHLRLPSASLVPDDPTVLLTIAGMLPFKPVFLGQAERPAIVSSTVGSSGTSEALGIGLWPRVS